MVAESCKNLFILLDNNFGEMLIVDEIFAATKIVGYGWLYSMLTTAENLDH